MLCRIPLRPISHGAKMGSRTRNTGRLARGRHANLVREADNPVMQEDEADVADRIVPASALGDVKFRDQPVHLSLADPQHAGRFPAISVHEGKNGPYVVIPGTL